MSTTDSPPVNRRKSVLKKSSVAESSPTSSAQASPLRTSINSNLPAVGRVNDDMAEKAARRKSAHFGDLAENGAKDKAGGNASSGAGQKRAVSALQVQAQQQANQAAGITGLAGNGKRNKRLSAVAPAAPVVSMEVMNTNFEEWMKLATDNKITANNTWNFALIDYFADLTLLRNDEDQSINFQKASCTLDGCVKIWTSRVDSVATETGKLLSGLAGGGGGDVDDEGAEGEEDEDGEPVKKIRKTARSEATLAKSFSTLQVKKFDLEFTVDPLFKKTCADFDEGGAMGLLMNHLGVDGKGRVVFDAGDAGADVEEEDGIEEEEDEMVDLTKLRTFMPSMAKTMSLEISDTLSAFKFSSDPDSMPDFATLVGLKDDFEGPSAQLDDFNPSGEAHDFFGDEDFDAGGGMGGGGFDDSASMGGYDDQGEGFAGPSGNGGGLAMVGSGEGYGPFDPRRQGGELVMALVPGQDEDGMFDYFDKGFGKSWAGAEHWKLKKVSRKDAAAAAPKAARTAKAPFTIDFNAPSTAATSSKILFAPAPRSSLTLPSAAKAARRRSSKRSIGDSKKRKEEWLLPDDMHFSSRQLLRLFLKPKFALRMRRNGSSPLLMEDANGEIDENFWAQAAADRVDFDETGDPGDNAPIPFESQFFHDDVDDAFVDDQLDGGSPGMMMDIPGDEDDLWAGTQGQELKKSRPENVHFAKKAKRVDVKRLKDDIWSGLKTLVPDTEGQTESEDETVQPTTPTKDVAPVKTFDAIIQNLRTTYPQEKMSEISTSFCFICLLHLANEEGLMIETARYDGQELEDVGCMGVAEIPEDAEEMENGELMAKWRKMAKRLDQGEKTDRIVGELQALKVYKDPTAGRAA